MLKKILITLSFLIFGFGLAQLGPYYQQHVKYTIAADVNAANFTYQGSQTMEYTNNSPDELREIYINLYWNAFQRGSMMDQRAQSRGSKGDSRLIQKDSLGQIVSKLATIPLDQQGSQNIHWIRQNGQPLKYEIQGTIMKVFLNRPIKPNSTTTFTMEWDAVIPQQIRRAGRNNSEGIAMTMTQWYPKIAEYDYDGWAAFDYVGREFHAPFADFDVTIKIDPTYVIGAGGTLTNPEEVRGYVSNPNVKTDSDGKATWHWVAKDILDFAWAADPGYTVKAFSVLGGPKVYLVYKQSDKTAFWDQAIPYLTQYYQLMNNKFGQYHWPSYSFIQGGDGGMEYGMCTMILGNAKSVEGLMSLMVHEGSHSWFQQMLATNESMYPWMDEGFTEYATDFVMNKLFPPAQPVPNPFVNAIQSYSNFTKSGLEESASILGDHHDTGAAYSFASYVKGELFLVQLGYIMGEQNLDRTLKNYFSIWNMKHPAPRDFMHIAQLISDMDLKWFYNSWIDTTKTINYGISDVQYGDASTTITIVNKGGVPMPVDFNILTKDKKVVTYTIPLNMMRTRKTQDAYGDLIQMPYWPWTQQTYQLTIPYTKAQIQVMGIDFSQRMADVDPSDNFITVK